MLSFVMVIGTKGKNKIDFINMLNKTSKTPLKILKKLKLLKDMIAFI